MRCGTLSQWSWSLIGTVNLLVGKYNQWCLLHGLEVPEIALAPTDLGTRYGGMAVTHNWVLLHLCLIWYWGWRGCMTLSGWSQCLEFPSVLGHCHSGDK